MGLRRGETVNVIVPVIVVGADHVSALFFSSECRNWASLSEEFRPQISQIIRILICVICSSVSYSGGQTPPLHNYRSPPCHPDERSEEGSQIIVVGCPKTYSKRSFRDSSLTLRMTGSGNVGNSNEKKGTHKGCPYKLINSPPLRAERNRSSACDDCRFIGTKEFLLLGVGLLFNNILLSALDVDAPFRLAVQAAACEVVDSGVGRFA